MLPEQCEKRERKERLALAHIIIPRKSHTQGTSHNPLVTHNYRALPCPDDPRAARPSPRRVPRVPRHATDANRDISMANARARGSKLKLRSNRSTVYLQLRHPAQRHCDSCRIRFHTTNRGLHVKPYCERKAIYTCNSYL